MSEKWVVEWIREQNCFHMQSLERSIEANVEIMLQGYDVDFITVFIGDSHQECGEAIKRFQAKMEGSQSDISIGDRPVDEQSAIEISRLRREALKAAIGLSDASGRNPSEADFLAERLQKASVAFRKLQDAELKPSVGEHDEIYKTIRLQAGRISEAFHRIELLEKVNANDGK